MLIHTDSHMFGYILLRGPYMKHQTQNFSLKGCCLLKSASTKLGFILKEGHWHCQPEQVQLVRDIKRYRHIYDRLFSLFFSASSLSFCLKVTICSW